MAVILMAEVHTSRSEFDTLRHLLSFIYDRDADMYQRIIAWANPHNSSDILYVPALSARGPREAEREKVYRKCGAEASKDGMYCGVKDLEAAAIDMVQHYWDALDPAVQTGETELMLVLTGDATGGWRGDAVTHGELGIGSWAKGKAQSKLTLLPIFLMEGDDGAANLRNRCGVVATAYNKLKAKGSLTVTIQGREIQLKLKLLAAADFQFFKAIMNMSKYTSAIWCTCLLSNLYKRPDAPAKTWADCLTFFDEIGCVMKDLATICELNHYSLEVLEGRKFKEFGCRCGWRSGNEKACAAHPLPRPRCAACASVVVGGASHPSSPPAPPCPLPSARCRQPVAVCPCCSSPALTLSHVPLPRLQVARGSRGSRATRGRGAQGGGARPLGRR